MRKFIFPVLLLFILTSLVYAGMIFLEYSAIPSTDQVTIKWITKAEENVSNFNILRSDDDQYFKIIGSVNKQGPGVNYTYIDEDVIFNGDNTFFYKIRAVQSNGTTIEETDSFPANPNISGIYRTWGAIKAMFK